MARSRLELDSILRDIIGSSNVYYEPPSTIRMQYPCIVYDRGRIDLSHANDKPYLLNKRYNITVIYYDPDDDLPDKIAVLPMCFHDRHFTNDNLQHDVFTLYY